jgi:hypothetical protein
LPTALASASLVPQPTGVLGRSGVGHGNQQETWKDALNLVFNKSNFKPAIFTSHSKVHRTSPTQPFL